MASEKSSYWDVAKIILKTTPLGSMVVAAQKATESGELPVLRLEAARQELQERMAIAQARVQQEYSIAHRIGAAEEVEIEEFYDTRVEDGAGATLTEKALTLGIKSESRRVVRRIYRFKGGDSASGAGKEVQQLTNT